MRGIWCPRKKNASRDHIQSIRHWRRNIPVTQKKKYSIQAGEENGRASNCFWQEARRGNQHKKSNKENPHKTNTLCIFWFVSLLAPVKTGPCSQIRCVRLEYLKPFLFSSLLIAYFERVLLRHELAHWFYLVAGMPKWYKIRFSPVLSLSHTHSLLSLSFSCMVLNTTLAINAHCIEVRS